MSLSVFLLNLFLLVTALAVPPSYQNVIFTRSDGAWSLGSDFQLTSSSNGLHIAHAEQTIWSATLPFISASAGNDSVIGSSGAFNITQVDVNTCKGQTITNVQNVPWEGTVTGSAVQIVGELLNCGGSDAPYTATFWVPATYKDRIAVRVLWVVTFAWDLC